MLARHESDFRADADMPLNLAELLALLDGSPEGGTSRESAIACYLSATEGWRDAVKQLRGTFAKGAAELQNRNSD